MLDIHVGIRRDELKVFKRVLDGAFNNRLNFSTREDRWEDWGVNWTDETSSPDDIIHVIITTDIPMNTLQFLVQVAMVFLNDITDDLQPFFGKYVVVSDHNNLGSFYPELHYPE